MPWSVDRKGTYHSKGFMKDDARERSVPVDFGMPDRHRLNVGKTR